MQRLIQAIQQIFGEDNVLINPIELPATPFGGVLLPQHGIAIHTVSLNSAFLHAVDADFFAQWAALAEKQGWKPLQIWEDVWLAKEPLVLAHLTSLAEKSTKVFARNTIVRRISKPIADTFLNEHHLGGSPSARYKYGLFLKKTDELVGVATFSSPRTYYRDEKTSRSFELIRYGSKSGTNITGGLSKVLKAFIDDVQPDDIMTYADCDWWTGRSYAPLGFKMVGHTPPQQFWLHPDEKIRYLQKHLPQHIKEQLKSSTNIDETMIQLGYLPIYNSGNRKFLLSVDKHP